jgi:hypothetical protein
MLIQVELLVAVQEQPVVAVTPTLPEPPAGPTDALAGEIEYAHGVDVTVSVSLAVFFDVSIAVTVRTLAPLWRVMGPHVQLVVPEHVPPPPRSLLHVTCITPLSSDADPPKLTVPLVVL